MKQLFACALFLITSLAAVSAQSVEANPPADKKKSTQTEASENEARAAAEALANKYDLNADQAKQVYAVQQRKLRNLSEIEPLKAEKRNIYLSKLESLQQGTLTSLRKILRTKEQIALYDQTQKDMRIKRAEKRKEMMLEKASKEDIQAAMLDIYEE
ncbi:MAG: hypothetical protein KDC61_09215 [Saprospiraceae bacterium]|nr:hypothetical protein [Saprospiraceae bacterium]MCB0543352.1 hypothetical protein [Saprospiraceae bacterium]MCB0574729.1 hypothetical protein [Saprospiraceae bacterium]MCB9355394.1 hypothetical protein [Lewinellaceae bacterium]